MDSEKHSGREDPRDNPAEMWAHMDPRERFPGGHIAGEEERYTYRMAVAEAFKSSTPYDIDAHKWSLWFREEDKGVNKDQTFFEKVSSAIREWNSIDPLDRAVFLSTGNYTDKVTNDLIATLTGARIIGFAEPTGSGGGDDIWKRRRRHHESDDDDETTHIGWAGIGWLRGRRKHRKSGRTGRRRTGVKIVPGEDYPITPTDEDETGDSGNPDEPIVPGETDDGTTDDGETNISDKPIVTPTIPGETDDEENTGDSGEPGDAEVPEENPEEEPDDTGDEGETGEPGETGESEDEESGETGDPEDEELEDIREESYEIIKQIKRSDLTAAEKEVIDKQVAEKKKDFLDKVRRGFLILLAALLLLVPPIDTVKDTDAATVTATTIQTESYTTPDTTTERKLTDEEEQAMRQELVEKLLQDTSLGDTIELPRGTILHNSSDYEYVREHGGNDRTVTVGESQYRAEGEYTVDRVSFLDEDGKIIKAYHMESGDEGSIQSLLERARQESGYEGEITIALHFDGPNGGGELSGQTGWMAGFGTEFGVDESQIPETITETIPGQTVEITTREEYSGQSEDVSGGNMEVVNEDGEKVTINIKKPDGTYRSVGETVIGSDGNAYEITSINVEPGQDSVKLSIRKLLFDLAMIGIAGTGIGLYLASKKKAETDGEGGGIVAGGETGDEDESSEEAGNTTETIAATGETENEREMMELTGEQLVRLTKIFSERAGESAPQIAAEMAELAGIDVYAAQQPSEEPGEGSGTIFDQMTDAEMLLAQALLVKHDEATLRDLSEKIGIDLEEYAELILRGTPTDDNAETEYGDIDTNEGEEA
ncbi:hypothetical protein J5500_01085 [Candidatus Saccharibacteria bacterium]|nr:hypothetical protein [Candidatus Saccharibacteria bacterium]